MNKLVALITGASLLCSASLFASNTTASWGAQTDLGVATSTGTPLPGGDLVMIGYFNGLSNAQITTASFSTLQADFIQFGQGHIGDPLATLPDGYWTGFTIASASSEGIPAGAEVYYWVLNASSFAAATQQGIFTVQTGQPHASSWVFPDDSSIPGTLTNDLDQVQLTVGASGGILVGSVGTGSTPYDLAAITAVPEPSTYASLLVGLGGIGLATLRRRFKK